MHPDRARNRARAAAFTLIELLAVIALLSLLAAIGSRALYAAKERTRSAQCRAQLAYLAQALADYKRQHGDFPFAAATVEGSAVRLFAAITEGVNANVAVVPSATLDADHAAFVDPWGNPYAYAYRTDADAEWKPEGFLLYSAGPDGASSGPDSSGHYAGGRRTAVVNHDNLYADEPR